MRQRPSPVCARGARAGSRVSHASSGPRAFCAAVSALKGGSGGRLGPAAGGGVGDIGDSLLKGTEIRNFDDAIMVPAEEENMTAYSHPAGGPRHRVHGLRGMMARAGPGRPRARLAGIAARDAEERVVAQMALADLPLRTFLDEALIPYEDDEVTRLIVDTHDKPAFAAVSHLTVGDFRDWL